MVINWKENKSKVLIAAVVFIAIVAVFYYESTKKLTTQAFINAPVISIRAPIPGRTNLGGDMLVGNRVLKGKPVAVIRADTENPRVSVIRAQLLDLANTKGNLESELQKVALEMQHRTNEHELLKGKVTSQQVLDTENAETLITMAESNLRSAHLDVQEAKRNFDKARELHDSEFVTQVYLATLEDEHGRAQARLEAATEQLKKDQLSLEALKSGIQIEGARTLPYVVTRSLALEEAIADLQAQSDYISEQIRLTDEHANKLSHELSQQMQTSLTSPVNGAVWDIISNDGDAVSQHSPVIKVVNCDASWVEAFLDESDAADLAIGDPVTVQEYFGERSWAGAVTSIRYKTGRVTVGQYMVDPPPEVMRRQLPVRVATVKIGVDWEQPEGSANTCSVGRSVRVFRAT